MAGELTAVLVGCGGISEAWLKSFPAIPRLRIVGYVDINLEAATRRRDAFGPPEAAVGTDLAALLDRLRPDAVFDCTVPEAHRSVVLTALEHGCHVLGEKPLADSMENAREMVRRAVASGRTYAVIQNRRYDRRIRRLRDWIRTGGVGPLTTVNSDFYIGAHFGGFRDRMRHVLILDMAIHTFDAARFLTGANPVAVTCREWNPPGSWYDHDASAVAVFEMTGGLVYCYRGSWCAEGLPTTWEADWRLVGRDGTVRWDGADDLRAEVVTARGGFHSTVEARAVTAPEDPAFHGGHGAQIADFVGCVLEGRTPETVCTDNLWSLAMVFGAIESAEGGRTVPVRALETTS